MTKRKKVMDVVFLLDRSGSMKGTEKDTIGGYNSYINSFKNENAKITTILFDNKYEMITERKDVNQEEMQKSIYNIFDVIIPYTSGNSDALFLDSIVPALEDFRHKWNFDDEWVITMLSKLPYYNLKLFPIYKELLQLCKGNLEYARECQLIYINLVLAYREFVDINEIDFIKNDVKAITNDDSNPYYQRIVDLTKQLYDEK